MLAEQINRHIDDQTTFFSLEFAPPQVPKTSTLAKELAKFGRTLSKLKEANPLYVDVTWFVRNDPGNLSIPNSSTSIAVLCQQNHGLETMLHICCNGNKKKIQSSLKGDDPKRPITTLLPTAIMPKIWLSGPGSSVMSSSYTDHLMHLKNKVDAGADLVVTQFFFETNTFAKFLRDCKDIGVKVPILPGILLYRSATSVINISKLSGVPIPASAAKVLEANRAYPQRVKAFALYRAYQMCHEILSEGHSNGVHIFTMNQKKETGMLLRRLGIWNRINVDVHRVLNRPTKNVQCIYYRKKKTLLRLDSHSG
uniref:Methylenetetrahydrofolate reductase (NAD(P)H) n=1 Tax=Ditylenchus dipsaci TaxID=166011 RepID=A0A915ECR6_9BILA